MRRVLPRPAAQVAPPRPWASRSAAVVALEFDLLWLLALPLFFGLGWLAARHESAAGRGVQGELPAGYFRGLNFLLSEQPDRAIDAFIEVVRVDPETVELHFALGKLFRQRGENDRAIRVHQSLLDRTDLDPKAREQALFDASELALGEAAIVPLYYQVNTWATRRGVTYSARQDEYSLAQFVRSHN